MTPPSRTAFVAMNAPETEGIRDRDVPSVYRGLRHNARIIWWFMKKNAVAIIEIIAREAKCSTGDITLNTGLEVLGIDSLKAIVILSELEDVLGIEIPNEIIGSIKTVGDIVAKIDELQKNKKTE